MPAYELFQNLTQRACVPCSSAAPICPQCSANEQCIIIDESCSACAQAKCQLIASLSHSSGGVSSGAVAGAVVASIIFLALVVGAFWFYRRRLRQRRAATAAASDSKTDAPARAEDVLNRPDPNEKAIPEEQSTVRIYAGASGTINLDPESQAGSVARATDGHDSRRGSAQDNPFGDNHSIQTTSTGTQSNVIPIALVPPASFHAPSPHNSNESFSGSQASSGPRRPVRTPDVNLNGDETRENAVANDDQSTRSDSTTAHNPRASYMSTGSYASDLLSEAPVIITPTRGLVKQQVMGLVKAEVIRTPPGGTPSKDGDGLRAPAANRLLARSSPLAVSSFGPSDVVHEAVEDEQEVSVRANPFDDSHSPYNLDGSQRSPAPSASTFGSPERGTPESGQVTPNQYAEENGWTSDGAHRPMSTYTQAASIMGSVIGADIGSATRVHLGFQQLGVPSTEVVPHTASSGVLNSPRSPYRLTSARLINTPASGNGGGALEQQQQRAMQDIEPNHSRMSLASVVSSASTKADSILESFPFVPPSPISNRPIRTPPRSPLAQQSFATNSNTAPPLSAREPPPRESIREAPVSPLPPPPRPVNRKAAGMSVASQSSAFSTGLGSFPFQIDSGNGTDNASSSSSSPSSFLGRQRASLDTLALTSDLSSYPLNFGNQKRDPPPPMPRR